MSVDAIDVAAGVFQAAVGHVGRREAMRRALAAHRRLTLAALRESPAMRAGERQIVEAVARFHHVEVRDMLGAHRDRWLTEARQEACWRLRRAGLSLPRIGKVMNRHHATVLHAIRQVDHRLARDAFLARRLEVHAAKAA